MLDISRRKLLFEYGYHQFKESIIKTTITAMSLLIPHESVHM